MKIKVLGSSGCVSIPVPTCQCKVCSEARKKGMPFSRSGSSIFIEDINAIVDTPEESFLQINRENIKEVENILYSHWHPDHTSGMRVIELLKLRWLDLYVKNEKPRNKIKVYALADVINDLKEIRNKYGSYIDYYKSRGLIDVKKLKERESINIKKINVLCVPVKNIDTSTVFVFSEESKKLIYAPCDIKPFPEDEEAFYNAEVLLIGNVIPDEPLKNGVKLPEDNALRNELLSMEDVINIKEKYNIRTVIVTHLEEDWGKSYLDYKDLEEKYKKYNIKFAYDGMEISI